MENPSITSSASRVACIFRPRKQGEDLLMPEEQPITFRELATQIVASYVRQNRIGVDQVAALIASVHAALGRLGKPEAASEERTPAVSIRRSVQRDYVVCLECGWRGKILRRHIATHGLTVEQYRERWKLPHNHAMIAPAYSERRSTMAKQVGLGRGRASDEIASAAEAAAETPTQRRPKQRGRPRSRAMPVASA